MTRALPGSVVRHTQGPEATKPPEILRVLSVEARGIEPFPTPPLGVVIRVVA
jgi:hypothetical protein